MRIPFFRVLVLSYITYLATGTKEALPDPELLDKSILFSLVKLIFLVRASVY